VSVPAFARLAREKSDGSFAAVLGPVWTVALLAGLTLSVLAYPLIELIYGAEWMPAAAVLAGLGVFGSLRTVFDLAASYLLAHGESKTTLLVQISWIAALVPAVLAGVSIGGIGGVAIAHVATAGVIVCPAYAVSLHRSGADLRAVWSRMWPPLVAAIPTGVSMMAVIGMTPDPLAGLFAGACAGSIVYALLLGKWFVRRVWEVRELMAGHASAQAMSVTANSRTTFQGRAT
jgi:O-antigen/teichoic acid export membrane protein